MAELSVIAPKLPPALASDEHMAALVQLIWQQYAETDLSPLLVYLIDVVREPLLVHLGEQFHVMGLEGWNLAETPEQQRRLIKDAIALHRLKGTPAALHELVDRLGFGRIKIQEGIGNLNYDGQYSYNGHMVYGDPNAWPIYRVLLLDRAITNDQATQLRAALQAFAPARCRLAALDYQSVNLFPSATTRWPRLMGNTTTGVRKPWQTSKSPPSGPPASINSKPPTRCSAARSSPNRPPAALPTDRRWRWPTEPCISSKRSKA